ncbi:MAG: AraC family transcriptional regulator, partial [Flavobacteriales bacterium]|nr:AraC family transcriptional regulator [Flavobacteriales bacterium]
PIIYKGKLIGVLDSEHSDYNFYNQTHIDLFQLASCMLSSIIYDSQQKKNLSPHQRFKEFKSLLIDKELFLQNDLNKKTISNLLGLSSQYLSKIISQFSDKSFPEIVNELRIIKAKKLLIDRSFSTCSISELSYEIGFSSKSSFNRAFKKHTQLTPREFKKFVLIFKKAKN